MLSKYPCRRLALSVLITGLSLPAIAEDSVSRASDGWDYSMPAAQLTALCDATVAQAREDFSAIENDTSPATVESLNCVISRSCSAGMV